MGVENKKALRPHCDGCDGDDGEERSERSVGSTHFREMWGQFSLLLTAPTFRVINRSLLLQFYFERVFIFLQKGCGDKSILCGSSQSWCTTVRQVPWIISPFCSSVPRHFGRQFSCRTQTPVCPRPHHHHHHRVNPSGLNKRRQEETSLQHALILSTTYTSKAQLSMKRKKNPQHQFSSTK